MHNYYEINLMGHFLKQNFVIRSAAFGGSVYKGSENFASAAVFGQKKNFVWLLSGLQAERPPKDIFKGGSIF